MQILIVEDEIPAAKRLEQMILEHHASASIVGVEDTVKGAVTRLSTALAPDLIFMDIQLADGLSFDIFSQVEVKTPVIFTTAYDQYMLKAFKVNSVDYLLKPIDAAELAASLDKFSAYFMQPRQYDLDIFRSVIQNIRQPQYKERFIVKTGQQLTYISVKEAAYFFSEDGVVQARTVEGKKYLIDYTLDQLEPLLSPADFFRINRKLIVHIQAVRKIAPYFNSRLILELNPPTTLECTVSRERVGEFKRWLDK